MEVSSRWLDALAVLEQRAQHLGFTLSSEQQTLCVRYCQLVQAANSRFNLTALREPESLLIGFVLDTLTVAALVPDLGEAGKAVDVGSGAGVPGIPFKIVHPGWQVTLLESIGKKARFLEETVEELGLEGVRVVNARAEEAGWETELRDAADLCLSRAVAAMPTLLELCAPFVKPGGWLAFGKGAGVGTEIWGAQAAAKALQVRFAAVVRVSEALGLGADRSSVLYQKAGPTPGGYPRRVGLARSRPIG